MSPIGGENLGTSPPQKKKNRASVILQLTSYKQICLEAS